MCQVLDVGVENRKGHTVASRRLLVEDSNTASRCTLDDLVGGAKVKSFGTAAITLAINDVTDRQVLRHRGVCRRYLATVDKRRPVATDRCSHCHKNSDGIIIIIIIIIIRSH